MLRLLLLSLCITLAALQEQTEETIEGSADDATDDEPGDDIEETTSGFLRNAGPQKGSEEDGTTMIIIIAAVSVVVLAIIAVLAILLFKRHLKNREQGVYTVPVEQRQKEAI